LKKKFSDSSTKASTSKIIELSAKNSSPIEVDLLVATSPKIWADDNNDVVSLESNDEYKLDNWTLSNQLYVPFSF